MGQRIAKDHAHVTDQIFAAIDSSDPLSTTGPRLVDLGEVDLVDLLDGPVTLYTPDGPTLMSLPSSVVVLPQPNNAQSAMLFYSSTDSIADSSQQLAEWNNFDVVDKTDFLHIISDPIKMSIQNPSSRDSISTPYPVWQANHAYVEETDWVYEVEHVWYLSEGDGTSAGSEPDWAAHLGDEVVDGAITWGDGGVLPSSGTVHIYALVIPL